MGLCSVLLFSCFSKNNSTSSIMCSMLHWWRVEKQLNCAAADDQFGADVDLSMILFSHKVCCSRLKTPDICRRDECFPPLAVFPFFTLTSSLFSLPSVLCAYIVLFSTSVSYPCFVPLIRRVILSLSPVLLCSKDS